MKRRSQNGPSFSKATYAAKPDPPPSADEVIRRQKLAQLQEKLQAEREADGKARKQALIDEVKRTGRIRLR